MPKLKEYKKVEHRGSGILATSKIESNSIEMGGVSGDGERNKIRIEKVDNQLSCHLNVFPFCPECILFNQKGNCIIFTTIGHSRKLSIA